MKMTYSLILVVCIFLGLIPSLVRAEVMLTATSHSAQGRNSDGNEYSESLSSFASPTTFTLTVTTPTYDTHSASATNTITRTNTLGGYAFRSAYTLHAESGENVPLRLVEANAAGHEYFTVDIATPYSVAGLLNLDEGFSGQILATLYDATIDEYLFFVYNNNFGGNVSLELGQPLGLGDLTGSLTGLLMPGHAYQFEYSVFVGTDSSSPTPNDINGSGFVSLQLGTLQAQEVPEPFSLTIWGLVGAGGALASFVSRRRQSHTIA